MLQKQPPANIAVSRAVRVERGESRAVFATVDRVAAATD
jgi:hypothetical protein